MSELYKRFIGVLKFEPNFMKTVLITQAASLESSLFENVNIKMRDHIKI